MVGGGENVLDIMPGAEFWCDSRCAPHRGVRKDPVPARIGPNPSKLKDLWGEKPLLSQPGHQNRILYVMQ